MTDLIYNLKIYTMILKAKRQKFDLIKTTHPDLFESIQNHVAYLSPEDKGMIAGIIIEAVIKSGGDVTILTDDIDRAQLGDIDDLDDELHY
jgi:hypothetical protein